MDPYGRRSPPPREIRTTSSASSTLRPSRWELRDFVGSWLLLSVAFTVFLSGGRDVFQMVVEFPTVVVFFAILSTTAVGFGFVLHEYAHKAVAVRLGQPAAFRANYGLLVVAIALALGGLIAAVPGAVHLRRDVPSRDRGVIALAGPLANVAFGFVAGVVAVVSPLFLPMWVFRFGDVLVPVTYTLATAGRYAVGINFLLAGFNMLPFGPLDGKKVYLWSTPVYGLVAELCVLLAVVGFVLLRGPLSFFP